MTEHVVGIVAVHVVDDPAEIAASDSPKGKPFLRLKFDDDVVVNLTTNVAEMIGGVGKGVRERHEKRAKGAH